MVSVFVTTHPLITFLFNLQDALKCIAWKGRALVIGFAGGTIEKVRLSMAHWSTQEILILL